MTIVQQENIQLSRRDRIVVSTLRCGRNNPGSNPGHGTFYRRKNISEISSYTCSFVDTIDFQHYFTPRKTYKPQMANRRCLRLCVTMAEFIDLEKRNVKI